MSKNLSLKTKVKTDLGNFKMKKKIKLFPHRESNPGHGGESAGS